MASETAEVAYVAAGYLRVEMSQGVYVYLLMSKSQVILLYPVKGRQSVAQKISSKLSLHNANRILDQIKTNN
ncbi:hypothetical protein pdam_00006017 [Pocillopora damicornis]|uniref:Uncharacterized protein n=1 Tax=Pocillopora damicornis TaxID=46731 RepID=A0A3M6TT34_POCDA|nr:hypothetical protein pdam_00006017 [Pocillopora damicornis]